MRFRTVVFAFLISLPALLVVGLGVAYISINVPGWIRAEPARITREYREQAERLLEVPSMATYAGARQKGWRRVGRVAGHIWGHFRENDHTRIWIMADSNVCRSIVVDTIHPLPYALIFYWGGAFVAAVIMLLTAFAVWSFLSFLRERDDFLAATAHDLTTPLAGLRFAIGRSPEDARMLVERLLLVVGNLKNFLRLGGRRPPPVFGMVDLRALALEAYGLFAADYRDEFDGLDVEISAEGTVYAHADATLVMQILWNLFGNDLKYAAPYGSVSVMIRRDGGFAVVEFADEGQGMTSREMKRAFDRYYRAKTVMQSGKGGFGIGLCTAREFARAMGGDLTVCANKPRGCVFALRLPAGLPPAQNVDVDLGKEKME